MKFMSVEDTSITDINVIFVFKVVREVTRLVCSGLNLVHGVVFSSRKRLILHECSGILWR